MYRTMDSILQPVAWYILHRMHNGNGRRRMVAMPKGDGSEKNPYLVETVKDLDAVREDLTAHYKQTADIDLSDIPHWEPIGPVFQGTYDGDFHTIEHLTVLGSDTGSLFHLLRGAVIRNLGLEHVSL